jgi:hypothetical protein
VSAAFPPAAEQHDEIQALLEGFASVVDGRTALYVSSPLTTGQLAADWHAENGAGRSPEHFRTEVVEPNRRAAARYVRELREATKRVVVDPTAVEDLPGWKQADYHVFWGKVIERYAETVVFRSGWQYSNGCAYELVVAHRSGATVLDESLAPLGVADGVKLLTAAVEECEARGVSAEFLRGAAEALSGSPAPTVDP